MPQSSFSGVSKTPAKPAPPRKPTNLARRPREHLTETEVLRLVEAAGSRGRFPWRDAALILVMYRHGLRVSEAVALRWDMIDLDAALIHVRRVKNGTPTTHPLTGKELRHLRRWQAEQVKLCGGDPPPHVFTSGRGLNDAPLSAYRVGEIVTAAAQEAAGGGFTFPIHPHMLRHSCGFYLASKHTDTRTIQLYLGHKNIQNTVGYTALSPEQFKGIWKD